MDKLDLATKRKLIEFACALAWADLTIQPAEREAVFSLMERLAIDDPGDRQQVVRWLKSPPPVDDLDPLEIPLERRELFVRECEAIVRADGVVRPEEAETIRLLRSILFGERKGVMPVSSSSSSAPAAKDGSRSGDGGGDRQAQVDQLNEILKLELAGVTRYLHYSFMIFGHNRIPIVSFFRAQAQEGMAHAILIGEKITALGGHPTIRVEDPPEPPGHDVRTLLEESLAFERRGLAAYKKLLSLCGDDVALEELTRAQIRSETEHIEEVEKMLRTTDR